MATASIGSIPCLLSEVVESHGPCFGSENLGMENQSPEKLTYDNDSPLITELTSMKKKDRNFSELKSFVSASKDLENDHGNRKSKFNYF